MKIGDVVIIAIWAVFLLDAVFQGLRIPHGAFGPPPPWIHVAFAIFAFAAAFFQRHPSRRERGWFGFKFWSGIETWLKERLRVVSLMMVGSLLLGVTGLVTTYFSTKSSTAYSQSAFFISVGLGLLAAYLLSLRYPPRVR